MNTIHTQIQLAIEFFRTMIWYHAFYWLFLLGYPLMYLSAILLTNVILPLNKEKPVERTVHLSWGFAFLFHLVAFVVWGLDSMLLSWFGPFERGTSFNTFTSVFFACSRLLPYCCLVFFDLFFGLKLVISAWSVKDSSVKKQKRE